MGLGDRITYEGEAALKLEEVAMDCQNPNIRIIEGDWLNPLTLLESVLVDKNEDKSVESIAFDFHLKMASTVYQSLKRFNYKKAAFSGGVFQNALLIDLIQTICGDMAQLYFHKERADGLYNYYPSIVFQLCHSNRKSQYHVDHSSW